MHEWGLAELGNCQPTVGGDLNIINRERDRGCGDASCLRRGISRFSRLATRWVGRHQARGCVVAKYQIFAGASHRNVVASIAGIAFTMSQDDSGHPPAPPRPLPQHTHTHTTPPRRRPQTSRSRASRKPSHTTEPVRSETTPLSDNHGAYAFFLFMVRSVGPRGPDPFWQEDHAKPALCSGQLRRPGEPA